MPKNEAEITPETKRFNSMVEELIERRAAFTYKEIANKIGISETDMSSARKERINVPLKYVKNLENVYNVKIIPEFKEPIRMDQSSDISKLIDSNHQLAVAQRELSEAHNKLAGKSFTVADPKETLEVVESMRSELLVLLAEIGSGELKWKSSHEAVAFLSKRFHGKYAVEKPKGIQMSSGKLSR